MTSGPPDGRTHLADLLQSVRRSMQEAGVEQAAREARQLIAAVTGIAPEAFLGHPELIISIQQQAQVMSGLEKRLAGTPLGRIAGECEFYGRPFSLGPATLEPRADSEVLIDAVLEIVRQESWTAKPIRIIDVGTGTGCLLVTLLAELPMASGIGVDISRDALSVARGNAERNGVVSRAEFSEGDLLANISSTFDILISNPPYIRSDEIAALAPEVRCHDPMAALDGGPDGLDFYRRIASSTDQVVPTGWLVFEIGAGMADAVCHQVDQARQQTCDLEWKVWHDLNGHARCVASRALRKG